MKYQTEPGEVEIALADAGPESVERMKQLREEVLTTIAVGKEFVGLARNADGQWVGIFRDGS